jgi:hypothetical protein
MLSLGTIKKRDRRSTLIREFLSELRTRALGGEKSLELHPATREFGSSDSGKFLPEFGPSEYL